MPTPYGSRGGVAFSADELRVLGGALAIALQSDPTPDEARDYLRLAEAVDETVREGYRLRSFLLADLARYREALPGAAPGYLDQLEAALTTGYLPRPDDLAALRALCAVAAGEGESARRLALLRRCESLAERAVRARLRLVPHVPHAPQAPEAPHAPEATPAPGVAGVPGVPGGRAPLHDDAAPAAPAVAPVAADEPPPEPAPEWGEPAPEPREPAAEPGAAPRPAQPPPSRPVPTPAEVFPPRKRPAPPPERETPDSEDSGDTGERGESVAERDPVPA